MEDAQTVLPMDIIPDQKRRPARESRKRPAKMQATSSLKAEHLVGYAYDEESVEAIMKKFEEVDRYMTEKAKQAPEVVEATDNATTTETKDVVLDATDFQELFKRTSYFTVESMTSGNETHDGNIVLSDDEEEYDEDLFFDSEVDEDGKKVRKRSTAVSSRTPGQSSGRQRIISLEVTGTDGYTYTVKKRVRAVDPYDPTWTRIPDPVPVSWAPTIANYGAPPKTDERQLEADILSFKFDGMGPVQGLLMDPPFCRSREEAPSAEFITFEQFNRLKDRVRALVPVGLLFIWVEKEFIADLITTLAKWEFNYVENFVWVKRDVNNKFAEQNYAYFNKSKSTCMIFRRMVDTPLELRHQRSPDVSFDFVRDYNGVTEDKPTFIYQLIETLLPQSKVEESNRRNLIELWGKKNMQREGWISIVQKPSEAIVLN